MLYQQTSNHMFQLSQSTSCQLSLCRLLGRICHLQGTEDNRMITAESVADGERQGTLDILWRIFLDLQV